LSLKNDFEIYRLKAELTKRSEVLEVHDNFIDPNVILYIVGGCLIFGLSIYGINIGVNLLQESFIGRVYQVTNSKAISFLDWWIGGPNSPPPPSPDIIVVPPFVPEIVINLERIVPDLSDLDEVDPGLLLDPVLSFVELTDRLSNWGCS
jgi:hypothetical protein